MEKWNNSPTTLDELPFVKDGADGRDFWHVQPGDDYDLNFELGQQFARLFQHYCSCAESREFPFTLAAIAKAQQHNKDYGLTAGFWFEIQDTVAGMWPQELAAAN